MYDDANFENISNCKSNNSFGALDDLSDFEEESNANGDSKNVQPPSECGLYFPFPLEIFFLLYSYAHNVSRPKVLFIFSIQRNESNGPANTQNTGLNTGF